jgi:hypothetical protein
MPDPYPDIVEGRGVLRSIRRAVYWENETQPPPKGWWFWKIVMGLAFGLYAASKLRRFM